jgi:hypothetical protein
MTATPTFEQVKALLITLADAEDENVRDGIYGRHNPTGGYSWESEPELLASTVIRPGTVRRLVPPLDYKGMKDDDITAQCTMIMMLAAKNMPPPKADTARRYATPDEIALLVAYVKALPFPRT